MIRIWMKTSLAILMFVTLSCDREDSYVGEVNYIAYGTSFGECQGYCNQNMKVYPQVATLRRYGCPDCADGGAEWVEISFDTLKHRVTFEFLNEPEELTPIVSALRELMLDFEGYDQ